MTGNGIERVYLGSPPSSNDSWWSRYSTSLDYMTPTARAALQADSEYILTRGIFGAGEPNGDQWPVTKSRTGLIMGSVQSGKTASMLGVAALALDRDVDIVIVLAGTRVSLWRQTYERLASQLDAGEESAEKFARRLLCPLPGVAFSSASTSLHDTYRLKSATIRRILKNRVPLIIVAMKQTAHLNALGRALRDSVFGAVKQLDRPVHMLVLDDEADDGSVLDSAVEAGKDPLSSGLKQIPRAIADLWEPRSHGTQSNLYTTYVGYTATPQANLLQEDHNPLAPRDFVIALRTPLDVGHPVDTDCVDAPKSSSYPEPTGMHNYYTGGEIYYRRGVSAQLCVELTGLHDEDLGDAIRAFLIAGAIRIHQADGKSGPASLLGKTFDSREAALSASPEPHSMLFNPSANIESHFACAEDILLWAGVDGRTKARELVETGEARLPSSLITKMLDEEWRWEFWIDRYRDSRLKLAHEFNILGECEIPDWHEIRSILETELIPGTRVSVVNSDPHADDRPDYQPFIDGTSGRWRTARDLSTIFVSGNVMSRGLTLEGLTTVLFLHHANSPFSDTQMQMQRWFGYRGKYIELCRVFASRKQIDLFRDYHDIDEALREGIAAKMAGEAPSPLVLHGMGFLATGKIADLARTPLCPGSKPFVTLVNGGQAHDPNAELVANLFTDMPSSDLTVGGVTRGRALDGTLSLIETADLLDSFLFDLYRPGRDHRLANLWCQVQARVSTTLPLPDGTLFYNAPDPLEGKPSPVRLACPYSIPAYLRLWDACLIRPVRGLFVTGVPSGTWSMTDLQSKQLRQPRFSVGIRYGAGNPVKSGRLADLDFSVPVTTKSVKRVGSTHEVHTTWGSNDPSAGPLSYRGDEFFDYYHRGKQVPVLSGSKPWRPEGSNGQILFYVNQLDGQPHPVIAVGVCIPAGGPEQFAATRAGSAG